MDDSLIRYLSIEHDDPASLDGKYRSSLFSDDLIWYEIMLEFICYHIDDDISEEFPLASILIDDIGLVPESTIGIKDTFIDIQRLCVLWFRVFFGDLEHDDSWVFLWEMLLPVWVSEESYDRKMNMLVLYRSLEKIQKKNPPGGRIFGW
jgi:hypothetical protein